MGHHLSVRAVHTIQGDTARLSRSTELLVVPTDCSQAVRRHRRTVRALGIQKPDAWSRCSVDRPRGLKKKRKIVRGIMRAMISADSGSTASGGRGENAGDVSQPLEESRVSLSRGSMETRRRSRPLLLLALLTTPQRSVIVVCR